MKNCRESSFYENMNIDSIVFDAKKLKYVREFGAVLIDFPKVLEINDTKTQVK